MPVTRAQVLAAQQQAPAATPSPAPQATPAGPTRAQVLAAQSQPRTPAQPAMTPSQRRAYEHERSTAVDPRVGLMGQGATFGFADELDALTEQGLTGVQNLGRRLTGQQIPFTAQEAHDAALRVDRENNDAQRRRDPQIQVPILGNVDPNEAIGGFALPWGRLNNALKLIPGVGRSGLARAIAIGAGAGGATSAGTTEGDAGHRLEAIPAGVAAGAATGGILHGAGRLASSDPVRRFGGAITEALSRVMDNLNREPGAPPTPAQAARGQRTATEMVHQMVQQSGRDLSASPIEQRGGPITSAEEIGRNAQTALKVAGRRTGSTPDALEAMLSERATETPHRIVDDFAQITGLNPAEIEGDFSAQAQRLRAAARPLYDSAGVNGPGRGGYEGPVVSDELSSLLKTPAVRAAMRNAGEIAGNERVPLEDVGMHLGPSGDVTVSNPTMRTWDFIKRGLDQELESFRDPVTRRLNLNERGRSINKVLGELRFALTDERQPWGPAYEAALNAGGEPIRLEGAFRDAGSLMSNNTRMSQFETRVANMTPAEREAFRAGIVNDVRTRAQAGRQRLGDLLTRTYEQKIIRVFGPEQGRRIIQRIQDERFLLTHGRRMQPGIGSDTSETELGAAEQDQAMDTAGHALGHAIRGRGVEAVLTVLADPIAGLWRGAQLPVNQATRDALGELLMMPPSQLHEVLKAHAKQRGLPFATDANVQRLIERMSVAAKGVTSAQSSRQQEPPPAPYAPSSALNQAIGNVGP